MFFTLTFGLVSYLCNGYYSLCHLLCNGYFWGFVPSVNLMLFFVCRTAYQPPNETQRFQKKQSETYFSYFALIEKDTLTLQVVLCVNLFLFFQGVGDSTIFLAFSWFWVAWQNVGQWDGQCRATWQGSCLARGTLQLCSFLGHFGEHLQCPTLGSC